MGKKDFEIKFHTSLKKVESGMLAAAKEGMASKGVEIECPACHGKLTIHAGVTVCPRCKTPLRLDR